MKVFKFLFLFSFLNTSTRFFLIRTILYYKNNEAQICPKIKNKLRTIEARLQIQM